MIEDGACLLQFFLQQACLIYESSFIASGSQ
jgi:hypothetical protein